MPSRNVIKVCVPDSYYHVYSRGASKQTIFIDEADYSYYLSLLERYLSQTASDDQNDGRQKLYDSVEVLAYCLMPNHFHLLLYQIDEDGMSKLMHGVATSYSRYFNKKYERSGSLFESRYKASRIDAEDYLLHISRYIHRNPDDWVDYPHSSLRAYFYNDAPDWLNTARIIELYGSAVKYSEFLEDYTKHDDKIAV